MSRQKKANETGPFGVVEDGFGSCWRKCAPNCRIEVVRPGKVQCSPAEECLVVIESNATPRVTNGKLFEAVRLYSESGNAQKERIVFLTPRLHLALVEHFRKLVDTNATSPNNVDGG